MVTEIDGVLVEHLVPQVRRPFRTLPATDELRESVHIWYLVPDMILRSRRLSAVCAVIMFSSPGISGVELTIHAAGRSIEFTKTKLRILMVLLLVDDVVLVLW